MQYKKERQKSIKLSALVLILFGFWPTKLLACEPPPVVGYCEKNERVNVHEESAKSLLNSITKYESVLESIFKKNYFNQFLRIGDGSCFLINHASGSLKELRLDSVKNKNKVCLTDVNFIVNESIRLIAPDSEELKAIKSRKIKNKLLKIQKDIAKKISDFKSNHR
jgi:hypothetical protein